MHAPDRIRSFADAAALAVGALELELGDSAIWIGHLDCDRGVLRVVATGGDAEFGLEPGVEAELETSFCQVMATGAGPQLANDASGHPVYSELPATSAMAVGSFVGAPMRVGDAPVGTLCAFHHSRGAFSERQLRLIQAFAAFLERELEHQREREDLEHVVADLRRQSLTDPLTGLGNRRAFSRALERAMIRPAGASLVLLDIDGLKAINDRDGHAAGDAALLAVAASMARASGTHDSVARLGGDEFAAVVHGDVAAWRRAVEHGLPVGISTGDVALADTQSPSEALTVADQRLYADKRGTPLAA